MKKSVLVFSITLVLLLCGMNIVMAQDKPKPKKDTINMDTNAKPTKYYAVEDEKTGAKGGKSGVTEIAIIAGIAVIIIGGIVFFVMRKKNK